jgi:predicted transcriptional regulator
MKNRRVFGSRLPNPTNVRLSMDARLRVDRIAQKYGIHSADLIRNALAEKLPEWERNGVKLAIISPN